ncbi:hypothetical protein KC19_11G083800 [Ceratodon purpureus]|uniref:Secreted protein n=1 Tax=Ceratodon purpureus TaxID=3225 RepID=A0A8T0GBT3_CERPU|nr:hypothetical protein KC19_11G083800 [Ceratodon purpureus]
MLAVRLDMFLSFLVEAASCSGEIHAVLVLQDLVFLIGVKNFWFVYWSLTPSFWLCSSRFCTRGSVQL